MTIAQALDLSQEARYSLRLSAAFHDIGLLGVPDPDIQLNQLLEERLDVTLVSHLRLGGRLVHHAFLDFPEAIEAIWYHHEWFDGSGPFGLHSDETPLFARIIALADFAEYRLTPRDKRQNADLESVISEIQGLSGIRFHPAVVSAFVRSADQIIQDVSATDSDSDLVADDQTSSETSSSRNEFQSIAATQTPAAVSSIRTGSISQHKAATRELRSMKPVVSFSSLAQRLQEIDAVGCWSPAMQGVLAATQSSGCSASDVARAISQDPLLSIRTIKLASSSPFLRRKNIESLQDAVTVLGFNEVRNLAVTCQVFDRFGVGAAGVLDADRFWEHSAACGLFAAHLGDKATAVDPYVSGILHDAGRLILLHRAADEYAEVIRVSEHLELPLEVVEARLLGTTHAKTLGNLMKKWGFDSHLSEAVSRHHTSMSDLKRLRHSEGTSVATIALSNRIVHALGCGSSGNDRLYPTRELIEFLDLDKSCIQSAIDSTLDELPSLRAVMATRKTSLSDTEASCANTPSDLVGLAPLVITTEEAESEGSLLDIWRRGLPTLQSDEEPTIAIVHVETTKTAHQAFRRLVKSEQERGAENLPTVILSDISKVDEYPELATRRHVTLRSPVKRTTLLNCMTELLATRTRSIGDTSCPCPATEPSTQFVQVSLPN